MAGHAHACIDIARIVTMDVAEGPAQSILVARDRDDVDVIGHQAIGPDRHLRSRGCFGEQVEIERIVPIFEEHPLAPVAPLGDVVRNAWKDDAREPGHSGRLATFGREYKGVIARVTVIKI